MHRGNLSIVLYVRDVNQALDFYCDVLAGKLAWAWHEGDAHAVPRVDRSRPISRAGVHFGKSEIVLQADPKHEPPKHPTCVVQLEVDDVDLFFRQARARGLKPSEGDRMHPAEPTDMPGGMRQVYVRDADGHCLSFASEVARGLL